MASRPVTLLAMRIVISGSSGLVGSALATDLEGRGHDVVRLVRRSVPPSQTNLAQWDPVAGDARYVLASDVGGIRQFVWSPDGGTLAAGDGEGRVLFWEMPVKHP